MQLVFLAEQQGKEERKEALLCFEVWFVCICVHVRLCAQDARPGET